MRVGERRVLEVVNKYGKEVFLMAVAEYLDYGDWVQIQGLNPATAEAGHVANGRVVSITATPLAGLPARYDAEITVALAAAR